MRLYGFTQIHQAEPSATFLANTILYLDIVSPKHFTFNDIDIRIPIKTESKERYKTPRKLGGKTYIDSPFSDIGKIPEDVMQIPAVKGNSKEKIGYPTQKPLKLLERIIKASSKEGDLVLDPFCGLSLIHI